MDIAVIGDNNNSPEIKTTIIEILNKKYEPIDIPKLNTPRSKMLMMAMLFSAMDPSMPRPKEYPQVDILDEFELIQKKQSKLSKSNREWVVKQFNKMYKEIK